MDDIIVQTILLMFFSVYFFQMVMEVVYQNDYGDTTEDEDITDEEDDTDTEDGEDEEDEENKDYKDGDTENIVTVAYQDKYLTKVRNVKQFKEEPEPLNINHLKNNFVMEYTPVGNVLMYYNVVKECFDYYSDSTIPYRYLEVVARKYVLMNNCVSLYFDMEEELKKCEVKNRERDGEKDLEDLKERIDLKKEEKDLNKVLNKDLKDLKDLKKSVFAKFKSYNKEGGTGHVNTAAPSKNNISQINVNSKANNSENVCLKEHANRYSHQGKILNFSMLQKVDRTKVDKKFAMTYADFKRLKNMERIYDKEDKDKDKETEDKEKE